MKSIILAWRKYIFLKRNEAQYITHFEQRRNQLTKANFLSEWYQKLMFNLPTRLLCEKAVETFRRHMLRTAMTQIATVAI
jgi:hypothetical protein